MVLFPRMFKTLDLCPTPVSKACTKNLAGAYGMTTKIKILFSPQTFYLGTAFAGKLYKGLCHFESLNLVKRQ
jgi:hypothetical protein